MLYIYMHVLVNSDGKVLIKAWNNFLWFITEHYWKVEAYFIRSKHVIIKQIISEKNYCY